MNQITKIFQEGESPTLRQIEWRAQNRSITKNGV